MSKNKDKTNVMRILDQKKITYISHNYESTGAISGVEVAQALNQDPDMVFKTLVTVGKSKANYVFVVPVKKELDLKKAARAVGEKSIEMIKSKELLPLTGYIHGGCSPIGMKKQFVTTIDQSAADCERIIFSGGKIGYQVEMSLFDLVSDEEKEAFEIRMPEVEEYPKEAKLAFEKEVLGVYISGHPLEEYTERWKKNITAVTADFQPDEETGMPKVRDGARAVVGGMITAKTIKYTKTNKIMAFLTLEDLVGTVEIVVFPRDYEKNVRFMEVDAKVFIQGRVSAEDDKASKLICENIYPFDMVPRELWLQFETKEAFLAREEELYEDIKDSDGKDTVVIYIRSPKAVKRLGPSKNVKIDQELLDNLYEKYGHDNVKVVEKSIENIRKML